MRDQATARVSVPFANQSTVPNSPPAVLASVALLALPCSLQRRPQIAHALVVISILMSLAQILIGRAGRTHGIAGSHTQDARGNDRDSQRQNDADQARRKPARAVPSAGPCSLAPGVWFASHGTPLARISRGAAGGCASRPRHPRGMAKMRGHLPNHRGRGEFPSPPRASRPKRDADDHSPSGRP